ncbi:OPT family oligopeptide transporter [Robinsoniella peoriensis]|uniref:OPT family oligopeptide transporter n=1 Tax=Robinsoniella peoriensis TaxID=180332 RepID=UPI00085C9762|nr:oligopeptide transporter, OPT family [Robinsoniella peoriensis]
MNEKQSFKPYIPADKSVPEFTPTAIILGVLLAVLFGGANAYLGLRVGMTVSASIPAAVISMGVIRVILRKDSVLENNMVQTIGSAGESVAAGAIFTLPALFLWAKEWGTAAPSLLEIAIIAFIGGTLGVLFMVPLRKALIVQEHGTLPYPEGMACAEVLLAGEQGGAKASTVFAGLGIAAAYKFITDGFKLFPSEVHYEIPAYKGAGVGMDVLPALLGVGYICGPKISSYLFAGGVLGWFVLMPLIVLFGANVTLFPATIPIAQIYEEGGSFGIWSNYIKYIGAGAVACGGILSLIKSLPLIIKTFKDAIKGYGKGATANSNIRTDQDLSMPVIFISILALAIAIWLIPIIPVNLFSAVLIVVFGFFFATVSSRMVGLIGSSNNPVSGMAIATLLISSMALKATGQVGQSGMTAAIAIGSVICIIAAIAGDTSQDLKTGYILGATPKKQQIGEVIGVLAAAIAIGGILYLLNEAWGYGSAELPAPQATLMKMVVEGVMGGNLPWNLVFAGVFIALVVEVLGIPVLPFAVGLYLPIHLSTPMMAGGLVRLFIEKKKGMDEKKKKNAIDGGVLYCSGLIAGEGLIGILLAVFAIIPMSGGSLGDAIAKIGGGIFPESVAKIVGLIFFALLIFSLLKFSLFLKEKKAKA